MNNKKIALLLADANEQLNQLSKIVKDNCKARQLILDNFFNSRLKRSSGEKTRVKIKTLQEVKS